MRRGFYILLGLWTLASLPAYAWSQDSGVPVEPGGVPNVSPVTGEVLDPWQFWVRGEFLTYWVKNAPLPISILTGDPANPNMELLNSSQNFGTMPGFRISSGVSLEPSNTIGLDTNFFWLTRRSRGVGFASDAQGNPPIGFQFNSVTPGAEGPMFLPLTFPGVFAGNVTVNSTMRLLGGEANIGTIVMPRQVGFEFTMLAGFRYMDLREDLSINSTSAAILTDPPTVLTMSDQFNTRNQFYGGQIGGRLNWTTAYVALDIVSKLAIGANQQSVDIQGSSTQTGPGGINGTFPGGFYTQPSNIGRVSSSQFSMIPSLEVKLHFFVTQRFTLFAGYDILYWTNVVRPGDQIDNNINLSQSAVLGGGALLGPAAPAPQFNRTNFWAHGFNVGFEFKF